MCICHFTLFCIKKLQTFWDQKSESPIKKQKNFYPFSISVDIELQGLTSLALRKIKKK